MKETAPLFWVSCFIPVRIIFILLRDFTLNCDRFFSKTEFFLVTAFMIFVPLFTNFSKGEKIAPMDEEMKTPAPLGANGTKTKEEEERLKSRLAEAKKQFTRWGLYFLGAFGGFVLLFVFLCLSASLGWPMGLTCTFLILDFLALIGAIFLLVWTHVNYYPPFKTARNRYEEFLQEQKLAA